MGVKGQRTLLPARRRAAAAAALISLLAAPAARAADEVPRSALGSSWSAPPVVLAGAALVALLFAQAFVRLRRRGRSDLAGWRRAALFAAGLALGVLPLVSPLDPIGEDYLLSAHMLQHVLISDLSPALLVLAVRGPLVFFLLPRPVLRTLAPLRPLRACLRALLNPWVTFWLWVAVIVGWHVPKLYDYALAHEHVHQLEHASFVLVGALAWTQLVDPARRGRPSRGGRIAFAIGMLALSHPVVEGLLFSGTPAYAPYARQPERLLGLSPLADQRLAAGVMFSEQLATVGSCIVVLLWPALRRLHALPQGVER